MQAVKTKFQTLEEVVSFVGRLEEGNHRTRGKWTSAQILYHLSGAFEGSKEALPPGYPRIVRLLIRPFRSLVTRFRFPPMLPIPASIKHRLDPPADADLVVQKTRLIAAIAEFQSQTADPPPHPVLGALSREEWVGFHLNHSWHHLRFLRMTSADDHAARG